MHNSEYNSEKENFDADGFIIVKGLFQKDEIDQIRDDAKYIFSLQLAAKGFGYAYSEESDFERDLYFLFRDNTEAFLNCGKHIQHLISLHRLSLDSRIIDKLKILGQQFPNICTRPVLFFNSKHLATKDIYHTTPAHQDAKSMDGSLNSMVVWLPLINVTKELGALQVVLGSHKYGLMTTGIEEGFGLVSKYLDKDFTSVELEKGDALFFSSYLVHRSGENSTNSIRWSCHFRYNDMADSDFIQRNFPHPYIYKPITKGE